MGVSSASSRSDPSMTPCLMAALENLLEGEMFMGSKKAVLF
jgi:hypothetical protein